MKRTALSRAMKNIKLKTPWLRWRRCDQCGADYKNRTPWGKLKMWRVKTDINDSVNLIRYGCLGCLPERRSVIQKWGSSYILRAWDDSQKINGPLDFT